MRMAARLEAMGNPKYQGTTRKSGRRHVWTGNVNFDESSLEAPLSWPRPKRIFVNSMSDLFQESVPIGFIIKVWAIMERAPRHTFQILTKRPERMRAVLSNGLRILPNVWLGTSVENSDYLRRLGDLRATPAAVRFVSFEPLLGPITRADLTGIDWAIVGGESGPNARPIAKEWVRTLRRLCREQGVAFFFKQWGGPNKKRNGRRLDGLFYDEYPATIAVCAAE